MRNRKLKRLLLAAACAAGVAVPATAAPAQVPSSGLEALGTKVSDAELAQMRGKFITPENISYFGIQMRTSWQGPDGVTTFATLLFSVDFLNGAGNPDGATPVLMIAWNREGDPSVDLDSFGDGYVAIPVGGLGSVQGAVQSQQIAGSDNIAGNAMQIAVVPASALQRPGTDGLTTVTTGESHLFGDGDTLQFILAGNEVGLALTGENGSDQVTQSFNGMIGQAAQHILLSSDGNAVRNGMAVTVGYDQLDAASRLSIQNALSTMKGIGF